MAETAREIIEDFSGGVNLHGPLRLAKNEFQSITNMHPVATPDGGGYLKGRGGQEIYNESSSLPDGVKSLYKFYRQSGEGMLLATGGTAIYRGTDVSGTFASIDTGYTAAQRFSFTSWTAKDKVYWINGVEVLKSYDGTTVAVVAGTPPIGTMVEYFQNRLWILIEDGVRFSDLNVDDVWQPAALINISDNKGGRSSFLKAANRVLIAGKTSGLWRLDGSPLLGSTFVEYSSVGCIAPWTADVVTILKNGQVIPVGVLFLGKEGVYLTDGFTVQLVSQRIDPLFNTAYYPNAIGKFYPSRRQYFLSFDTAGAANDTLWVGTSLDTGEGTKVAWSEYTGFNADSFAIADGGTDNGEMYIGESDTGNVFRFDTNAALDDGVAYTCEFTTRFLDFKDPGTNKGIRWMKATFSAQRAVDYLINYFDKQQSAGSVTQDKTNLGIWDVSQWDQAVWAGPALQSTRTSEMAGKYGRYASVRFRNRGDGRDFEFFHVDLLARIKDKRFHDVFTLNMNP